MRNYYQVFLAIILMASVEVKASDIEKDDHISTVGKGELYNGKDAQDFASIEKKIRFNLYHEDQYKKNISSNIAVRCPDYFTGGIPKQQGGKVAVCYEILESLINGLTASEVGLGSNVKENPNDKASLDELAFIVVSLMELTAARESLVNEANKALNLQLFIEKLKDHSGNRFNTSTADGKMRVQEILRNVYAIEE
jgi:hypothetical protein